MLILKGTKSQAKQTYKIFNNTNLEYQTILVMKAIHFTRNLAKHMIKNQEEEILIYTFILRTPLNL
jgi:hypothetical protein